MFEEGGLRGVDRVLGVMVERNLVFERCVYWLGGARVFEASTADRDGQGLRIWLWGFIESFQCVIFMVNVGSLMG